MATEHILLRSFGLEFAY